MLNTETAPSLPRITEPKFGVSEIRILARQLFTDYKALIDIKFPLVPAVALGQAEFINEAFVDTQDAAERDVLNFLYLPPDVTRSDPEEQVKVSSSKDRITITIKKDYLNPEVSFQTFEDTNDATPPIMSAPIRNTTEAVRRVKEMHQRLKELKGFSLLHSAKTS